MMRSLFSAVSGLKAHQQQMDVIGNNIANVNTPGYKKSRVSFQDTLYQTIKGASRPVQGGLGGTNPMQIGPGVGIGSIDTIFGGSNLEETGKDTDLGITGDGFFCVSDGSRPFYTRAGNFSFDQSGNLTSSLNGMNAQGWVADTNGKIDPSTAISDITIPTQGVTVSARATTKSTFAGNLSASTNGAAKFINGTTSSSFTVKDSNGIPATMQITLTPSNTFNTWNYTITSTDGSVATGTGIGTITLDKDGKVSAVSPPGGIAATVTPKAPGGIAVTINQPGKGDTMDHFTVPPVTTSILLPQTVSFTPAAPKSVRQTVYDSLGSEYTVTTTFTRAGNNTWDWNSSVEKPTAAGAVPIPVTTGTGIGTITFNASGQCIQNTGSSSIAFTPSNDTGASPVTITPDFSSVTQYASDSSVVARNQDGYQEGSLDSITFDNTGTILGVFSNGTSQALAQIALARFANPTGLLREGESMFSRSNNSGEPILGTAATTGYGSIKPGSLEASNVDLASEFTNMIITQRGFEANSKVITASDEMLQTMVNLKR